MVSYQWLHELTNASQCKSTNYSLNSITRPEISLCGDCAVNALRLLVQWAVRRKLILRRSDRRRKEKSSMQEGSPTNWNSKLYSTNHGRWISACSTNLVSAIGGFTEIFSSTDEISISSCHDYHIFLGNISLYRSHTNEWTYVLKMRHVTTCFLWNDNNMVTEQYMAFCIFGNEP